jgi:hypothetical protein
MIADSAWLCLLANVPGSENSQTCDDDQFKVPPPPKDVWVDAAAQSVPKEGGRATSAPFMPKLEAFTATGLSGRQICWFVERRKELGVPLKEVFVEADGDISKEDEAWLRENLENFGYFEDSDDEFDDEDDEDEQDFQDLLLDIMPSDDDFDDDNDGMDDLD